MNYIKGLKCRECGRPYPKQLSTKGRLLDEIIQISNLFKD